MKNTKGDETHLYNETSHSYLYVWRRAGQMAGPIGLKFFVGTHGWPGGDIDFKKIENIFFQIFFPRPTPDDSAIFI